MIFSYFSFCQEIKLEHLEDRRQAQMTRFYPVVSRVHYFGSVWRLYHGSKTANLSIKLCFIRVKRSKMVQQRTQLFTYSSNHTRLTLSRTELQNGSYQRLVTLSRQVLTLSCTPLCGADFHIQDGTGIHHLVHWCVVYSL